MTIAIAITTLINYFWTYLIDLEGNLFHPMYNQLLSSNYPYNIRFKILFRKSNVNVDLISKNSCSIIRFLKVCQRLLFYWKSKHRLGTNRSPISSHPIQSTYLQMIIILYSDEINFINFIFGLSITPCHHLILLRLFMSPHLILPFILYLKLHTSIFYGAIKDGIPCLEVKGWPGFNSTGKIIK